MDSNTNLLYTLDPKMMKDQNQHIQVFVRVRPMNIHERSKNSLAVLDCPGNREVVVKERALNNLTKTFTFDRVFGPASKQVEVYKTVVAPLIEQVLLGYNCTVFAYGQTGTGKTFTMEGERSTGANTESLTWETDPLTGIVPRALSQLFDELRVQNAEFTVRVSLLELYNEELYDLLSPMDDQIRTLRLYEDSNRKGSVIIQGLEEVTVHSKHEVYGIIERGSLRRKTGSTQMNANSSRSHTVFTVTVHIKEANVEGEELLKIGKLHLVDLAGSENIGRSGAVDKRAREAGSINQSLLTLGRVITALVERAPHIPYRESKLTRILQDSLGGRTKTSIIATVSPASYNVEETLSTLDYAHRAKNITNRPEINQKLTKRAILKAYTEEIERLRRDLVATREKNGVFMDKENYDLMTAQLDCQNQDLSNSIAEVRSLQDALAMKEVELTFVKGQWEETKDDLAACNQVLEETRQKLQHTLVKLCETELKRDQQEHLVEKHVVTEKQLTCEAAQLLYTTEESTSSLEKLYRKLERKKTIEQTNLEAGHRFSEDLGSQFNSMCISLEMFRVDHASFCGVQRMKLDSFLQDKELQFANLSSQIMNFLKEMSNIFSSSKTLVEKENDCAENWTTSIEKNVTRMSTDSINDINLWKEKIINVIIVRLDGQLKSLLERMKLLGSAFDDHVTLQSVLIDNFVTARVQKLEENRKAVEKFLNDQILANDYARECAGRTEHLTDEFVKTFEGTINTISSGLQVMVENANAFKSILANNSTSQVTNIAKSMSLLEEFKNDIQRDFDINKIESNLLRNNSKDLSTLAQTTINEEIEKYQKNSKDGVQYVADVQDAIQSHTTDQKDLWLKTQKYISTETNSREKHLRKFGEEYKQVAKVIENQISDSDGSKIRDVLKTIDINRKMDQDFVCDGLNELGEHCNITSQWADETRGVVLQQSGKLVEFWDSSYVTDVPTGATPQRKSYDFPKSLSATSPHERIISRFTTNRRPIPMESLENNEIF